MKNIVRLMLCLGIFGGMYFTFHPTMEARAAEAVYRNNGTELYYRLSDGTWGNEHWELKNGDWYYVGADGHILKNSLIVAYDNQYYVLDEKGRMLRSQTYTKEGVNYIINEHGVAVPEETEDELLLREYAASIMKGLVNDSMTDMEKCEAVLNYHQHLSGFAYNQTDDTDLNLIDSGMKAFDLRAGNCYVICAELHYLLEAVGVKDMIIGTVGHWWNLVKIGDQYRHLDITPFIEGGSFFLTTEELYARGETSSMLNTLYQYQEDDFPKAY